MLGPVILPAVPAPRDSSFGQQTLAVPHGCQIFYSAPVPHGCQIFYSAPAMPTDILNPGPAARHSQFWSPHPWSYRRYGRPSMPPGGDPRPGPVILPAVPAPRDSSLGQQTLLVLKRVSDPSPRVASVSHTPLAPASPPLSALLESPTLSALESPPLAALESQPSPPLCL
jgi:hypothetical protein